MNHIHRLMQERDEWHKKWQSLDNAIMEIMAYLSSDKFHGEDMDGSSKDWVCASEMWRRILDARHNAMTVEG